MLTHESGTPSLGGMWEWNAGAWIRVWAPNPPAGGVRSSLTHDSVRGRTVVSWANTVTKAQWDWDGTAWSERQLGLYSPSCWAALAAAAFDGTRGRLVEFGGVTILGVELDQTWQCFTLSPATFAAYGRACPGSNGMPRLASATRPWTASTLRTELRNARPFAPAVLLNGFSRTAFAGGALPFNVAALGAPLCDLLTSVDFTPAGVDEPHWHGRHRRAHALGPAVDRHRVLPAVRGPRPRRQRPRARAQPGRRRDDRRAVGICPVASSVVRRHHSYHPGGNQRQEVRVKAPRRQRR